MRNSFWHWKQLERKKFVSILGLMFNTVLCFLNFELYIQFLKICIFIVLQLKIQFCLLHIPETLYNYSSISVECTELEFKKCGLLSNLLLVFKSFSSVYQHQCSMPETFRENFGLKPFLIYFNSLQSFMHFLSSQEQKTYTMPKNIKILYIFLLFLVI